MAKNGVCKKCNNLVNGWCEKVIDSPDPDMVRDCRHFWEKTNADRIRAMSDEELADWLARTLIDNIADALKIAGIPWEQHPDLRELTAKDNLEWLKQPASEPPKEEAQQDCRYNRNGHCTAQKMMPECDPKSCDRGNHHEMS